MLQNAWKTDNFPFVQKTFKARYSQRTNKLFEILGQFDSDSIDYQFQGLGGFGEFQKYNGSTLNQGTSKRGFISVLTPEEYNQTIDIPYKMAKVNKLDSELKRVGTELGVSGAMTVYLHGLRLFGKAFDPTFLGGDGKAWAATDHPVASKGVEGRTSVADTDAGTFSNLMAEKLSVAAISKAQIMAREFVTPNGLPMAINLDTILVSAYDEETIAKLIGADKKLYPTRDPESAENAANPLYDLQYMVVADGKDGLKKGEWAICDRALLKESAGIVYITRPEVKQVDLDNPYIDRYVGYIDFCAGFSDAHPIIFSQS